MDTVIVYPSSISVDQSISAGEVEGVVIDGHTGALLSGAKVVVFAAPQKPIIVLTNDLGEFHLVDLPLGSTFVYASLISFRRDSVEFDSHTGARLRISLRYNTVHF